MRTYSITLLVLVCALLAGCAPPSAAPIPLPAASAPPTSFATAPDQFFTAGDVRLRYRDIGQGEPIVLLHGFTDRLERWGPFADSLAREHRVIALDLRGHGQSSKPGDPSRYGVEMVDDVARLLDHLGLERAPLVGHSMGATVAGRFALRHPTRAATATLVAGMARDTAATVESLAPSVAALERGEGIGSLIAYLFPMLPDSVVAGINQEMMARNDPEALLAVLKTAHQTTVSPAEAAAARVPVLAVTGTADPLVEDARRLARSSPEARLVEIPAATHLTVLAHPELLAQVRALIRSR